MNNKDLALKIKKYIENNITPISEVFIDYYCTIIGTLRNGLITKGNMTASAADQLIILLTKNK